MSCQIWIKPSCFFYVNITVVYRRGVDICKNLSPPHTRMLCVKFDLVLLEKIFFSNLLLLSPTISAWPFSDPMLLCAKHGWNESRGSEKDENLESTRCYQKLRGLMRWNQYFLRYAYKCCREYKTTNILLVVKI